MSSISFVDYQTVVPASWLNDVNRTVYLDAINVKNYGAVGDGVTDDTAALNTAVAIGKPLYFPAGVYCYNGFLQVTTSISGYGATIKQTRPTVSGANAAGLVTVVASNITIRGLSLDCDLKSSGFTADGFSNLYLEDCVARNAVNIGFGFFNADNIVVLKCFASDMRYYTVPSTGSPADGFYFGGCTRSRWISCVAENFRRIGFVSEGAGATKSGGIQALFCVARDANNCDDSTTEYNVGFWAENTNSVDWLYCEGYNLAGNAGQTSNRVIGMVAFAIGNASRGVGRVIGCRIYGGTGYLPVGISIEGSGGANPFADVIVEDTYINRARTGISTLCGINQLTISRLTLDDIVNSTGSDGGIVINGGATARYLLDLLVEKISITNSTLHANAGVINWFSNPAGCNYTLRAFRGTHVMRNYIDALRVEDSTVACGSTNYSTFLAVRNEIIDSHMQSRNASSSDKIIDAAALPSGSEVIFRGGSIRLPGGSWTPDFNGTSITLRVSGVRHEGFCWKIGTTGSYINEFNDNTFETISATNGAILTNGNAPTKQVCIIVDNYFNSTNIADTPIRKSTNNPTNSVITGNTYTATNITDFSGGVVAGGVNFKV